MLIVIVIYWIDKCYIFSHPKYILFVLPWMREAIKSDICTIPKDRNCLKHMSLRADK